MRLNRERRRPSNDNSSSTYSITNPNSSPSQSCLMTHVVQPKVSLQRYCKLATVKSVKVLSVAIAISGTALAINYAVRTYALAQWTAAKDFIQQCQIAQQPFKYCQDLKSKTLSQPPYASNRYYEEIAPQDLSSAGNDRFPNIAENRTLSHGKLEHPHVTNYRLVILSLAPLVLVLLTAIVFIRKRQGSSKRSKNSDWNSILPWTQFCHPRRPRKRRNSSTHHSADGSNSATTTAVATLPDPADAILRLRNGRTLDLSAHPPDFEVESKITANSIDDAKTIVNSQCRFITESVKLAKETQLTISSLDVTRETAKGKALN